MTNTLMRKLRNQTEQELLEQMEVSIEVCHAKYNFS